MAKSTKSTKSTKSSKAASKSTNASKSATKSSTPAKAARDAYGSAEGTQCHAINSALSLRATRTIDEIMEATGLGRPRISNHIRFLVGRSWAKAVGNGYRLLKPKAK